MILIFFFKMQPYAYYFAYNFYKPVQNRLNDILAEYNSCKDILYHTGYKICKFCHLINNTKYCPNCKVKLKKMKIKVFKDISQKLFKVSGNFCLIYIMSCQYNKMLLKINKYSSILKKNNKLITRAFNNTQNNKFI